MDEDDQLRKDSTYLEAESVPISDKIPHISRQP
jgi:hypothetical protein